jgi:hypothetical protein
MRFRFTIRDLLWLAVVVALVMGLWHAFRKDPYDGTEFDWEGLERFLEYCGAGAISGFVIGIIFNRSARTILWLVIIGTLCGWLIFSLVPRVLARM